MLLTKMESLGRGLGEAFMMMLLLGRARYSLRCFIHLAVGAGLTGRTKQHPDMWDWMHAQKRKLRKKYVDDTPVNHWFNIGCAVVLPLKAPI